jgi:hypothetical protein
MQSSTTANSPRLRPGSLQSRIAVVGFPTGVIRLSSPAATDSVRFLSSQRVKLATGSRRSWVTITRTGNFHDPRYGDFDITLSMLEEMVRNFDAGVAGQEIFLDVEHERKKGAAARFVALSIEGNRLRGQVEWTPYGVEAVRDRGFIYLSAEFHPAYKDNETREQHGTVLLGAGLTTRPVIKRLDPVDLDSVELSADFMPPQRTLVHPELVRQLSENWRNRTMKWLDALRKKLLAQGLNESVVKQLCETAKKAAANLGDDQDAIKALSEQFESTGDELAKSIGDKKVELSIDLPAASAKGQEGEGDAAAKTLSEDKVGEIVAKKLAEAEEKAAQQQRELAETLDERRRVFSEVVDEAEGLDDAAKKALSEEADELIDASMPEAAVRKLAERLVDAANREVAARKLSGLGYSDTRSGTPRISIDDSNRARKLSECIRENLAKTSVAQFGGLKLAEKDNPFVERVLAEFDTHNAHRIDHEVKVLSGDVSVDSNTDLPVGFQREVIREALSDQNVLALLQQLTDFGATTTFNVPYEERDVEGILNDGIVYEGQGIPSAGIEQKQDPAYINAMKLAMRLTNEVMHFSRASQVNWDAWARNAESNSRAIRDLLQRRVANNLMRSSDAYNAIDISDESIAAQLDGSTHTIKTAEFPVVRPLQVRDISGNNIGSAENPITIDFDGTPVTEWDGSGEQSAGTYYRVTDYNLGYIQLVDKDGTPVTPEEATATISYSHATNIVKFDVDFDEAETTLAAHFDGLLRAVGNRKAVLNGQRQVNPDFSLLSPVLADQVTNAKGFVPLTKRAGASANDATGDLERVKGLPMFETNAPQLDMGDSRIIIGQRGVGAYGIAKPWMIGQPFEAVDGNGRPTGKKVAYGEEYNVVHVPRPVRYRFSSVLVYSASGR